MFHLFLSPIDITTTCANPQDYCKKNTSLILEMNIKYTGYIFILKRGPQNLLNMGMPASRIGCFCNSQQIINISNAGHWSRFSKVFWGFFNSLSNAKIWPRKRPRDEGCDFLDCQLRTGRTPHYIRRGTKHLYVHRCICPGRVNESRGALLLGECM